MSATCDVNWQRCNNDDNDKAVTLLCTLVWHRWQLTALWQWWHWQCCDNGVNWQRYDSDVHISNSGVTAVSVVIAATLMCTSLSQHCHYHCCHSTLCSFSLLQSCAHRWLTAVGFLLCTLHQEFANCGTLWESVLYRCVRTTKSFVS